MRRALPAALVLVAALVMGGCGEESSSGSTGERPVLVVSAASSLKSAFTEYGRSFRPAEARFSFAGSDVLAAQIEQGVKPDVFAAANTKLPERLYEKGLVERPVVFAGNRLVVAVPGDDAEVRRLDDLAVRGVSVAIGARAVPVGDYARTVLERLPPGERDAILDNVRSEEPDVAGIVGKLTQGAADAGFVYISDVRAAGGRLEAVELPDELQPQVAYGAAVVKGAKHPGDARAFIRGLVSGDGRRALEAAGFGPPPA